MKIKANEKLSKFSSANLPCSSFQFGKLEDGQAVEIGNEEGKKLISMGLASEIKPKKVTKEKK
tara:strand:- start:872 stop:1060 length:189 start_codon:yes stop_codon:yes gene_type:complete